MQELSSVNGGHQEIAASILVIRLASEAKGKSNILQVGSGNVGLRKKLSDLKDGKTRMEGWPHRHKVSYVYLW